MQIKPVSSYGEPGYPIRPEVDARPEILRLLPKRWQGNAAVVAALTACIALATCGKSAAQDSPSRVAPVFIHGGGIGAFGCMSVSPPVFLSEDDARKVIVDEAKRAGISLAPDSKTVEGVQLPTLERRAVNAGTRTDASGNKLHSFQTKPEKVTNLHSFQAKPVKVTKARPIVLDGFDRKHNIAFEYVSSQDFNDWKMSERLSTVYSYDLRDAADKLRNAILQTESAGTYGVFYDPLVREACGVAKPAGGRAEFKAPCTDWQAGRTNSRAVELDLAREQLRAQVKDFIKWLKAQGVI
jgi:hypothetical protein